MALTQLEKERLDRAMTWELAVQHMSKFTIPVDYYASEETGKYERFVGYLIEWT